MVITKLLYFDSSGKNFEQKLCHHVVGAEAAVALRLKAKAIQKLLLPHPIFNPFSSLFCAFCFLNAAPTHQNEKLFLHKK